MTFATLADDDTFIVVGRYLERCGITNLRHPHTPARFNKTAILRHLMAAALQDALDNPPTPAGQKARHGTGRKRARPTASDNPPTKSRQ